MLSQEYPTTTSIGQVHEYLSMCSPWSKPGLFSRTRYFWKSI